MEHYVEVKKRLMFISEMAADAIIRRCIPMEDELSENQARRLYGDKWLRKKKREGLAHWQRKGIKSMYSRAELDKLRAQEREPARILFRQPKEK